MTALRTAAVRFTGQVELLSDSDRQALFARTTLADVSIGARVAEIIARVRKGGDAALCALSCELDGVSQSAVEVDRDVCERALYELEPRLRTAMERAARNIRRVHEAFLPTTQEVESEPGIVVGRRPDALQRVGVYAPGGRASYPSSVLMGAIPARVAGVNEVVLCSPPMRASGQPASSVLAAAALAKVDRVFAVGGAGAIAAMAYGTSAIPSVDRIVGPGNAYVAEAKLQVSHVVAIDSPAGPSELLILADDQSDPAGIARELLAQAEHDPHAAVLVITSSAAHADTIVACLETIIDEQPRAAIVREALETHGAVLWTAKLETAIRFTNEWAAEHVLLLMQKPDEILPRLRNAGTVFIGAASSVAFGDYMTGANHVLPTGGLAKSYSGLSTLDFIRWTTYQRVSRDAAARLANDVAAIADSEGLPGHANAARVWVRDGEGR